MLGGRPRDSVRIKLEPHALEHMADRRWLLFGDLHLEAQQAVECPKGFEGGICCGCRLDAPIVIHVVEAKDAKEHPRDGHHRIAEADVRPNRGF